MKANDIQIGQTYIAKVNGKVVPVRVTSKALNCGWNGVNTMTDRVVFVRTSQHFIGPWVSDRRKHDLAEIAWRQVDQIWHEMKARYPDTLMLFRMGNYYEFFHDDANQAGAILGLPIGLRIKGDESFSVAWLPVDDLEPILKAIVAAGKRAAVCEQVPPSEAKGKSVERIVSAGSLTEEGNS